MTQFTVSRRAVLGGAASALLVPAAAHATTPARHYDEMTDVLIVGSGFAGMAAALAAAEKGVKVKVIEKMAFLGGNSSLSGGMMAQYQGFADVGMGRGAIVIGLAAVIIGEAVFGRIFHNFALKLVSVSIGAIIYYVVIQLVLTLGFDANLLKLLSASVVAVFLAVPYWKSKYFSKPVKKAQKEDAKNA